MSQGNAKKIGLDHGDLVGKDDDDHTQYMLTAGVEMKVATLTNTTKASSGTDVQWGTQEVTFTNPGRKVQVWAILTGRIRCSAGRTFCQTEVQISDDGGSTWTAAGTTAVTEVDISDEAGESRLPAMSQNFYVGTPTGDIQIRGWIAHGSASANNGIHWENGRLVAQMMPAA